MTLRWDQSAVRRVVASSPVGDALVEAGWQVAAEAARRAPKASGEGAASIHPELFDTGDGLEVRVSWDRDHFYMAFAELGTEHQSATPFLRPAADSFNN